MKRGLLSVFAMLAISAVTNAQLTLTTQFINPCGGDEHNEFIVAKTGANPVNIGDIAFGSYNPSTNSNGTGGTAVINYNYWWAGKNVVSSPYATFSPFPGESCGNGLSCFGFRYPSVAADNADISTLITQLNTIAGCNVFIPVPSTDVIPANSNVIFFLGAGYVGSSAVCGFDNAATNLNFSNHCSNGAPVVTYYAVFGNGNGAGTSCSNTSGGYFSNSSRRISVLASYQGGDTSNVSSYVVSQQDYTPGSGVTGNAGIIVPNGSGGTTWIANQGCVPTPTTVLAIRLDYFTAILKDKKGLLKWRSSFEEAIKTFYIEKSLDGRHFSTLKLVAPKNISGSEYDAWDETLATGNNFYRLKVLNLDGTVDYSAVVKITLGKGNTPSGWYIYPNPAEGSAASLVYQSVTRQQIVVRLSDAAGKLISRSTHNITPGNNLVNIPADRLSAGMYLISIEKDGQLETAAFIKK